MRARPPIFILVLDMLGCALIGIGALEKFGQLNLIPEPYRIQHFENIMIIAGMALFLPAMIWFIKQLKSKQTPN